MIGRLPEVSRRLLAGAAPLFALWLLASPAAAQTRYLDPAGTDASSCAASQTPCRTFDYAYRHATAGDTVVVAAGAYPAQRIPIVPGRTGAPVEFRPVVGADVSLADLEIAGGHVSIRGISAGFVSVDAGDQGATEVPGVSVVDVDARGFWVWAARDLEIRGGSYGPRPDKPVGQIAANPPSHRITIDGAELHDATASNQSVHTECLWAGGVQGLTVRNSRFSNCAYFDIFITKLEGPDPRDVLLENNDFGRTTSWDGSPQGYGVNVANWLSVAENFVVRDNTFATGLLIQPPARNFLVVGNTGASLTCASGVTDGGNEFATSSCSASEQRSAARAIASARLERAALCRRSRPGCRRTATRLRLTLSSAAQATARVERARSKRVVRVIFNRSLKAGRHAFTLRGRSLARGRYRVVVRAGGETVSRAFTVR